MIQNRTDTLPSASRGPFVCGVLLGLSIGLAAGHLLFVGRSDGNKATNDSAVPFALWESMDSTSPESELPGVAADVEFSVLEVDPASDAGQATLSDEPSEGEGGLHFFPEAMTPAQAEPPLPRNTRLAFSSESAAENPLRVTADIRSGRDAPPQALQPVPGAAPIDEQTSHREQLARRLIQEELPDATQQERDVWCDVLQGLPAEDIKGILRMRKRLGASGFAVPGAIDSSSSDALPDLRLSPSPSLSSRSPLTETALKRSLTTLRVLRDLDRLNLAHQDTVAFKRLVPVVTEEAGDNGPAECRGLRLQHVFRDMSPGRLFETGRVLDVAIDGRGFLQFRRGDEVRYTRDGRLTLDGEGRLTLAAVQKDWVIDPPITIGPDAGDVTIETDGRVLVMPLDGDSQIEVGVIDVVLFLDPAGLQPVGEGLYVATRASGQPQVASFGAPRAGKLVQGHLEASNVEKSSLWERLNSHQALIEQMAQ